MINQLKLLLILAIVMVSCKEKSDAVENIIKSVDSPALSGSVQPFFFKNNDNILMSWTQKVNDSMFTLNYSTLAKNKWTQSI